MGITIKGKQLSENGPLYFVADIGANHDGSLERAYKLIELAKESGADAAKFQNFQAHKIVSAKGFSDLGAQLSHQAKWKRPVYEVYKDASVPFDWTPKLKQKCDEVGIDYFTSPYDFESVDAVEPYVELYKIGSGDITWLDMISYIARKNKPVLIAAGASTMDDVDRAMRILLPINPNVVLLQCNTNYTGDSRNFDFINLNVLKTFREAYPGVLLGLSDHTEGHATVLGALALGARVFEKHFTDDNNREGPDHKFAMNPSTWKEMVQRASELYRALGDGVKRIEENELQSSVVQRRSIRAAKDLASGHVLSASDLEVLRPIPEGAVPPYEIDLFIGKKLKTALSTGDHLTKLSVEL